MKVCVVGLGRMGNAIARRLHLDGHQVIGYDPSQGARSTVEQNGVQTASSLEKAVADVKAVWLMVPAGEVVDKVLSVVRTSAKAGTVIIDGGNSHFTDSKQRALELHGEGISFLDCGTSGGVHSLRDGFCLMVGGDRLAFEEVEPIFKTLSAQGGYGYMGPSGSGHCVKMVHNGIEYALLQAYADGFNLLKKSEFTKLDLAQISGVWSNGSVIRSWIVDLCKNVFDKDQDFKAVDGCIEQGGTGKWTIEYANEREVDMPLTKKALDIRFDSCKSGGDYATKLVALLRNQFGGHKVIKKADNDTNN